MKVSRQDGPVGFGQPLRLQVVFNNSKSELAVNYIEVKLIGRTSLTAKTNTISNSGTVFREQFKTEVKAGELEEIVIPINIDLGSSHFSTIGKLVKRFYAVDVRAHIQGSFRCCSET
jgi:hypothetical protein